MCASLATAGAAAAHRPQAVTRPPTAVQATSATLQGLIVSKKRTFYFFRYGTTTAYGSRTAVAVIDEDDDDRSDDDHAATAVSAVVTGLAPSTTYHAQLVAVSHRRVALGGDVAFTTAGLPAASPPAPLPPAAQPGIPPASPVVIPARPPVLTVAVNVVPRTGTVTVNPPGPAAPVALSATASVPVGTLIDTRHGSVTLRTALPGGRTQSAIFHGGLFQVRQPRGSRGLTELALRGALPTCGAGGVRAARRATRRRPPRRLWGHDRRGRFRTRGSRSVATVRGTVWLVEDRCSGTLTRVRRGSVSVRDLRRHRTVIVRAGHSYLARKRR